MKFNLPHAIEILSRTPDVLRQLLAGLSDDWTTPNEGGESWSAYDIVGHLIHGELTDWIPRAKIILSDQEDKHFIPFDRFAQLTDSKGKTLIQLLDEFDFLRQQNLDILQSMKIQEPDLQRTGIHPDFNDITLKQLLSTWVVHDLNHIGQIARVMAKQYKEEVGPWVPYLKILQI